MICPICKCGHTQPGFASVTLERDAMTLLVKQVPAEICENCGEEFIDEAASVQLLSTAEAAMRDGVQVELRQFAAA
ncbi:MAG: type II toxin-antitoxin system MqsA family antitoxin [Rhodocyclaceae bacterium]|jgi:YgiT-type zinc finger domain-containing protein|nr:type II toxin-antitoxin system MqsA family antitoxin [Rhodocyclaceae bacterium]